MALDLPSTGTAAANGNGNTGDGTPDVLITQNYVIGMPSDPPASRANGDYSSRLIPTSQSTFAAGGRFLFGNDAAKRAALSVYGFSSGIAPDGDEPVSVEVDVTRTTTAKGEEAVIFDGRTYIRKGAAYYIDPADLASDRIDRSDTGGTRFFIPTKQYFGSLFFLGGDNTFAQGDRSFSNAGVVLPATMFGDDGVKQVRRFIDRVAAKSPLATSQADFTKFQAQRNPQSYADYANLVRDFYATPPISFEIRRDPGSPAPVPDYLVPVDLAVKTLHSGFPEALFNPTNLTRPASAERAADNFLYAEITDNLAKSDLSGKTIVFAAGDVSRTTLVGGKQIASRAETTGSIDTFDLVGGLAGVPDTLAGFRTFLPAASVQGKNAGRLATTPFYMYVLAGRGTEAVAAAEAAAKLFAQAAETTPIDAAYSQITLGRAYQTAGRLDPAERALSAAVAGFKDARGSRSFDLAPALNGLGEIALLRGKPARAEAFFRRTLAIQQRWDGESALATGVTLSRLAVARAAVPAGREEALALSAQAVAVVRRRLTLGEARPWTDVETERRTARTIVEGDAALVAAGLKPGVPTADPAIVARLFEDSQLANATRTGGAIAQLAARLQEAQGALAADLRRRNDLADEWRAIQDDLVRSLQGGEGDDDRRAALLARQRAVYDDLGKLDTSIGARDPNVDLVIRSRSVSIAAVQGRLAPGERVIAMLLGADNSVVIAIDRDGARAVASPLSAAQVGEAVVRLRGGLDRARWPSDDLPLIDVAAAHLLYRELLGPLLPEGSVDTLLVVADGALASVPLATLLTAPVAVTRGQDQDYGAMPWLVRRFAITGFPSASSLVALRGIADRAPANGFLGVGDPVLGGSKGRSPRALAALLDQVLAANVNTAVANTTLLRTMTPLPETRLELTAIRNSLRPPTARLLVGAAANETALRRLDLKPYGVIAFATHGLIAGELAGYAEPALVLTPPAQGSQADDGLLSASEIARLDLRAQWVILSACSTAASDGSPRAEPLSGLARAFFYAGARSLLVTHWSIDSEAAAITTAATVERAAQGLSSAKALREAQLDFIGDRDKSGRTHPFFWAAFQMIGGR